MERYNSLFQEAVKWYVDSEDESIGYFPSLSCDICVIGFDTDLNEYFVTENAGEDDYENFNDLDGAIRLCAKKFKVKPPKKLIQEFEDIVYEHQFGEDGDDYDDGF